MDIAALSVKITADTSEAEAGLSRLNSQVSGAGSAIAAAFGGAAIAGVAALGAGLVGSIKSAADFEKQMSAVGAVAGASASEMQQLTSAALQLGKDTSFSASEAAKGIEELVKAGVGIQDVLGGGARAALDLAAAGAISVGDAAEIASNAMNVFGLKGADMAHVADVIAGAANASAIGVNDYKFSLASAGAVAATVGISFESLSQAIAVMGNAGIKGSDAGTSLKTMLLNLQPQTNKQIDLFRELGLTQTDTVAGYQNLVARGIQPTGTSYQELSQAIKTHLGLSADISKWSKDDVKAFNAMELQTGLMSNAFFDAGGNAKDMAGIAQVLKEKLGGMTKAAQLATLEVMFGSDAIRAGAVLLDAGAEGFTKMADAMGKVSAQDVANERLNNLWGSVEKLKGSLETGAIMLGGLFTPAIKSFVDQITEGVNQGIEIIEQLPDAWRTAGQAFAGAWEPSETLTPFMNAVGETAIMLRETFGPAVQAAAEFITGTLIPGFQQIAAPLAAFVAGFGGAIASLGLASAAISAVAAVLGLLLSPLGLIAIAVGLLAAAWVTDFMGIQGATAAAWAVIQPLLAQLVDWLGVQIPLVLGWLTTTGWPALVAAGQAFADWVTGVAIPAITQIIDWLGPKIVAVLTWMTETGWPALVAAGTAFSEWITGTAIPAITSLVDWLGPKISAVTTWISDTGWPALVAAGTAVGEMIGIVIKFFQDLYVELEKRGVFTELGTIWDTLTTAGGKVWDIVQKITTAMLPLYEALAKLTGVAGIPALITGFEGLVEKGGGAKTAVDLVAGGIQLLMKWVDMTVSSITTMLGLLDRLANFKMPSFNLPSLPSFGPNGSGGGIPGLGEQSFTPLRNIEQMNTAALYTGGGRGAAQVNQFSLGLSPGDAEAACGPAALAWFMNQTGRTPTGAEALRLAQSAGWSRADGMYGPGAFSSALSSVGIPNTVNTSPSRAQIDALAQSGTPFALSTGEHYYQVQGGSAAGLNVGGSGTALRTGAATMSLDEILARGYGVNGIIVPNAPPTPPAPASRTPQPGVAPGDQFPRVPLGSSGGAPGFDPAQWPGFMQQVNEQLPDYLTSLDTIQQHGTKTFTQTAQAGTAQAAVLSTGVGQQYDLMATHAVGSVNVLGDTTATTFLDTSGNTVTTVTSMQGQVVQQYATLANGVSLSLNGMGTTSAQTIDAMSGQITTTVADMSGNLVTTVTTMSGQIVAQYATTAAGVATATATQNAGVQAAYNMLGAGVTQSVTDMGTSVVTKLTDTSGVSTTTVTDMAGVILSQMTTLKDGTVVQMNDMNVQTTASFDAMAQQTTTTVTTLSGTVIQTITDMHGQIVAQTVTAHDQMMQQWVTTSAAVVKTATDMGLQVVAQSRVMGENLVTATKTSTGEMVSLITNAAGEVIGQFKTLVVEGKTVATGLDAAAKGLKTYADGLKNVGKEAAKAADQIAEFNKQAGGSKSGSGKGKDFAKGAGGFGDFEGKAVGGPVDFGQTYLVGEHGPELFRPNVSGTIVPSNQIRTSSMSGGVGGSTETLVIDFQIDGRTAERIFVTGREIATRRGRG